MKPDEVKKTCSFSFFINSMAEDTGNGFLFNYKVHGFRATPSF